MKRLHGFTLIEVVMVIAIIGVLSVVALPKFIDLKGETQVSAVRAVAGALSSAMAVNYTARKANASTGVAVTNCTDASAALQSGTLPTGASVSYSITAGAVAADAHVACTLTDTAATPNTATFTAVGIL